MNLIPESLEESLNFERGQDPKKSIRIGLKYPRRFETIDEFVDYIISAMPLIFNGEIPDDILNSEEHLWLPIAYFQKIATWLKKEKFEMPNGNTNWDYTFGMSDEFAHWPKSIALRLEQMLDQKR
jgi:hypothetical protein